jgi:radical SAM superfamily enzyme YgiQ (UPF0313 family)
MNGKTKESEKKTTLFFPSLTVLPFVPFWGRIHYSQKMSWWVILPQKNWGRGSIRWQLSSHFWNYTRVQAVIEISSLCLRKCSSPYDVVFSILFCLIPFRFEIVKRRQFLFFGVPFLFFLGSVSIWRECDEKFYEIC